jgi:hypothetical protein
VPAIQPLSRRQGCRIERHERFYGEAISLRPPAGVAVSPAFACLGIRVVGAEIAAGFDRYILISSALSSDIPTMAVNAERQPVTGAENLLRAFGKFRW